ncbi:uncharacterized protein F5891DRAFT_1279651 [Suillus fuscotomentosus]|uniref:Uncharacterized protein n=1 Tax=Suillus fuscotomentosus TaxID=1912939 RepID=A0AAD4E203_9AGAM|nr:uncharacterized protein F5891DRAFT_1279651 [Suillus fuscotomentosus]KAG1898236.1 hypothetical protein F5891DRAFT_1279651 [Suillus fuscotomentosus]
MNSQSCMLEELTANLESCRINTNATDNSFSHGFVGSPIGPCQNFLSQVIIDNVTPGVLPAELAYSVGLLSPSRNFTEHQSWDSFARNHIAPPTVDTRMVSFVEAYLVHLQSVHGPQLTVSEAISIIKHYLQSAHPYLHHDAHFGHFAFPAMPLVAPVEVSPMSFDVVDMGPGTSAGISMERPAVSETESAFGVYDMDSLRRIFVEEGRYKVECLWPNCGRIVMKDNHSRHVRECHLRATRGAVRPNYGFHMHVG